MKTSKLLTILFIVVILFFLSACQSLLTSSNTDIDSAVAVETTEQVESSNNNVGYYYVLSKNDSTKEESILADQNFEFITNELGFSKTSSFASLGFDISEEDSLIYAKSSALIGDNTNELKMLAYLGYEIDEEELCKSEFYDKAVSLYDNGEFNSAYQLFSSVVKYKNSEKYMRDLTRSGAVEFYIGQVGPAGGYIFYDKGSYSDGWRYLEAAPKDLEYRYQFGGYGINVGTSEDVGSGKANTEKIIKKITDEDCAARACSEYELNCFDDWFLPSIEELDLMCTNLYVKGIGAFRPMWYWSSSEDSAFGALVLLFREGYYHRDRVRSYNIRYNTYDGGYVRPIRAF